MKATTADALGPAADPMPGQGELFDREFCQTWHDTATDPDREPEK